MSCLSACRNMPRFRAREWKLNARLNMTRVRARTGEGRVERKITGLVRDIRCVAGYQMCGISDVSLLGSALLRRVRERARESGREGGKKEEERERREERGERRER